MYFKYFIKAVLLFGLIGALVIACADGAAPETSSTSISITDAVDSAAADKTAAFGSGAEDTLAIENPRITTTTNYQSSMSFLGKLRDNKISPHFTDQQIIEIAKKLEIPENIEIGVSVGEPHSWEAAGIDIAEVSFYRGNSFVAGAECEVNPSNLARSIYKYEY